MKVRCFLVVSAWRDGFKLLLECKKGVFVAKRFYRTTLTKKILKEGLTMVEIKVSDKCTGCETCVNTCPVCVYEMKDGKSVPVRVDECIVCRTCESSCPEGAIQVIE